MNAIDKKRQHWLDADDNEVYASELRTAAAIYIAALEAELEALKCCGNCGRYDQKSGDEVMNCYAFSDPDDCEQASPFDRCHFKPSRWTPREASS